MYVQNPGLGALGQTASTQFTAGSTATLTFTVDTGNWMAAFQSYPSLASPGGALDTWSPFSSGAFQLVSETYDNPVSPSLLTLVIQAGANGTQYTYGLLSSSISTTLNAAFGGFNIFSPANLGPGLAPASNPTVAYIDALSSSPSGLLNAWSSLIAPDTLSLPWGYILLIIAGLAFAYEVS